MLQANPLIIDLDIDELRSFCHGLLFTFLGQVTPSTFYSPTTVVYGRQQHHVLTKTTQYHQYLSQFLMDLLATFTKWVLHFQNDFSVKMSKKFGYAK